MVCGMIGNFISSKRHRTELNINIRYLECKEIFLILLNTALEINLIHFLSETFGCRGCYKLLHLSYTFK